MNRSIFAALTITVLAATLVGCGEVSIFAPDKSSAFARIETGLTAPASRDRVVELMGAPVESESSYRDLFGLSHESLTFRDGKRSYHVTLINGVVISKSIQPITQKE